MGRSPLTDTEELARALARSAFEQDKVRLTHHDASGCTHLVATRRGLFAVDAQRCIQLAFGSFYGLTIIHDAAYAFEACDLAGLDNCHGRIVRFDRLGEGMASAQVVAKGLENGCHQIDFLDGLLHVVDSQNQRILRFDCAGTALDPIYPLPPMRERAWSQGYAHINSLLQVSDRNLLLLHNGFSHTGRASEVAVFSRDWQEIARWPLPGKGCHNLVVLEDGRLISCGSMAGEIIGLDAAVIRISDMMTRGLSVGHDEIVVGAATFSARHNRHTTPGTVTFLDRDYRITAQRAIPGAPTEIRRIDGRDLGLSAYRATLPPALRGPGSA